MQVDSEPWYMYKKITTARDVALLLSDYMNEKQVDTCWICKEDLEDWIELDRSEVSRIFSTLIRRLHTNNGIDRKVYVYAIKRREPPKKNYRYKQHYNEYLIGTSREARIRDLSSVSYEVQKEVRNKQVL